MVQHIQKGGDIVPPSVKAANSAVKDVPTNVRVIAPYRVVHEGNAYVGGDELTVPQSLADEWLRSKWVEPSKEKS